MLRRTPNPPSDNSPRQLWMQLCPQLWKGLSAGMMLCMLFAILVPYWLSIWDHAKYWLGDTYSPEKYT